MLYDFLQSKGVLESIDMGKVIDIGSGDGREGKLFEEHGYGVTSIDIKNGIDATTYSYPIGWYNIAIANNSLPFMKDKQFEVVLSVYNTLKEEGYFYGTVFGNEEPWVKEGFVTPLDFENVRKFLEKIGFQFIWQSEEKGLGRTMKGDLKKWHIFKFLVKK